MPAPNNPYREGAWNPDESIPDTRPERERIYDPRSYGLTGETLDAVIRSAFTDGVQTERQAVRPYHAAEKAGAYDAGYDRGTHEASTAAKHAAGARADRQNYRLDAIGVYLLTVAQHPRLSKADRQEAEQLADLIETVRREIRP